MEEEEVGESCVKHQSTGVSDGRGIGTPKPEERKKSLLWSEAMKRGLVEEERGHTRGPGGHELAQGYVAEGVGVGIGVEGEG